jgi:hypothetical protein
MTTHDLRYAFLWEVASTLPFYETRFNRKRRSLAHTMPTVEPGKRMSGDIEVVEKTDTRDGEKPQAPAMVVRHPLADIFETLARDWKNETAVSPSLSQAAMHPSYQRIIGLGPKVIPLILEDLRMTEAPWFWALRALTGENPVPSEHRGKMRLMTHDWLRWGQKRGLIAQL